MPDTGQPVSDEQLPVEQDQVQPLPKENIDLSALFGEGGAEFGLSNTQSCADKEGDGAETDDTASSSSRRCGRGSTRGSGGSSWGRPRCCAQGRLPCWSRRTGRQRDVSDARDGGSRTATARAGRPCSGETGEDGKGARGVGAAEDGSTSRRRATSWHRAATFRTRAPG